MTGASEREPLLTERRNPGSMELDTMSVSAAFDLFRDEDRSVSLAVAAAKDEIVRAVELVARQLERGGRLIYVGAGTSGRLAALDAAECPPTFHSDPEQVQAVIAGGDEALRRSVEGAEDDTTAARQALDEHSVGPRDVVFGIAASGTTPFVREAIRCAKERDAATVFFACVPREQADDEADVSIRVLVGPEVLTGSTRLKAGTATKLVLNTISTLAMVKLGKVHGNLMVDLAAGGNAKLADRAVRIVQEITGLPREEAAAWLERAGGRAKRAMVMQRTGASPEEADRRLEAARGSLRRALER